MWGMRGIQPFCFDRSLPKNCLRKVQVLWMVRNQQPEMWNQKKCHFLGDFGGDLANWAPQGWGLEVGSISSDDTHWKNHPESEPWEIGAPSLWIKEPWRQKTHLGKVSTKKSNWESLTPRLSGWQKKTHPPPKSPRNHPRTPFTHRLTDSFPIPSQPLETWCHFTIISPPWCFFSRDGFNRVSRTDICTIKALSALFHIVGLQVDGLAINF